MKYSVCFFLDYLRIENISNYFYQKINSNLEVKNLFEHLNKFINISEKEFQEISSFFEVRTLRKKEILGSANRNCNHDYFILRGCLHMFFINEKGDQQTIQFGLENWWITDNLAFLNQAKTDFFIQAVENSDILSISYEQKELLLKNFPQLERYFRIIYQIAYGASLNRMKFIYNYSKEERYFHFIQQFPDFAQRVPQYLIASFLGLSAEYVSEIRNKRRS